VSNVNYEAPQQSPAVFSYLNTIFSKILTLNMADEISNPYKTAGKLVIASLLL
jgi:hypothetical protein